MQKRTMGALALGAAGLVAASVLVTLRYAHADGVPGIIPIQGCATDSVGKAIDGSQQVEFRLYSTANAAMGDALHMESRNVTFRGCVFSETLHPADLGMFEKYGALYLGVKIAGDAELSPRFEVGASPYAVQARHADKASLADNGVPPGTIVAYGGASVPSGWLLCNGSIIDPVAEPKYAALRAAVLDSWGDGGDGTSPKFNLPDLGGRFLRGVDNGAELRDDGPRQATGPGGNTGNMVGTVEDDSTAVPRYASFSLSSSGSHNHMTVNRNAVNPWGSGPFMGGLGDQANQGVTGNPSFTSTEGAHSHQLNGGDAETRPINAAVNYIIKY